MNIHEFTIFNFSTQNNSLIPSTSEHEHHKLKSDTNVQTNDNRHSDPYVIKVISLLRLSDKFCQ
jgi:hypothetical protein